MSIGYLKHWDANLTITVIVMILYGSLVSCGESTPTFEPVTDLEFENSYWKLISLNNKPVDNDIIAQINFEEDDNLIGSTGCNLFSGSYSLGMENNVTFYPILSTKWDCKEILYSQEQVMLHVLSSASHYAIVGDVLSITSPEGKQRGTFLKIGSPILGGTNWNLVSFKGGQGEIQNLFEGTQIRASFGDAGILSGFAGCNEYISSYESDQNYLTFNSISSTHIECVEPIGVMDQENNYLQVIESTATYKNLGIALILFDARGQIMATYINADSFNER